MSKVAPRDPSLPVRADAEALLTGNEKLLWFWRRDGFKPRPWWLSGATMIAAAFAFVAIGWLISLGQEPRYMRRMPEWLIPTAAAFFFVVGVLRLARKNRAADELLDAVDDLSIFTAYALTQHRLLLLARTLSKEIALEPGEPRIQYGNFRIDRPDLRGRKLISRIPMAEQHRLFAALKQARLLREGQEMSA